MAYGTIKVDNITFDNGGVDKLITVSGLFYSTSGALTVTGAISGGSVTAPTATFTTLTGTTTAGTTATFTSGSFTSLTGVTTTVTSGIFALGTAAAPSITISGDLNTGIYSPGADQLAIATAGTGRLFVDAGGNVGIGTGAAAAITKLQVVGVGTFGNGVGGRLQVATDSNLGYIDSLDNTSTNWQPLIVRGTQIQFHTNAAGTTPTEKFRIDGSGNVGIGGVPANYTGYPNLRINGSSGGILDLSNNGTSVFRLTGDTNGVAYYTQNTAYPHIWGAGATERMRIDGSGNLGLGVTPSTFSVGKALEIGFAGNTLFGATSGQLNLMQNATYNAAFKYASTAAASYYQQLSGAHIWYTAPSGTAGATIGFTQAMTLDAGGNLGVGATSPGASLHVAGAIASAPAGSGLLAGINGNYGQAKLYGSTGGLLDFGASGADANARIRVDNSDSALQFFTKSGSLFERMRIDGSGNLGLGVVPSAWSGVKALQINTQGSLVSTGNLIQIRSNAYFDGAADRYIATSTASDYYQNAGAHVWRTAPSGTAGATISFTHAMTLDASGRLLVGTSSPSGANLLQVNSDALIYGITVGRGAGAISGNTAIGFGALQANTTGSNNTANGLSALQYNTTGASNTANGVNALLNNTTGNYNTANGLNALRFNTTGNDNTANGVSALYFNTTGVQNTANGRDALFSNTTGASNTAIGLEAGYGDGTLANTTGSNNTFIGYDAIGASATASNVITLGNGSIATLRCQVTTITSLSDARDKTNITNLPAGLDFINALRPVAFDWNTRDGKKVGIPEFGFLAHELQEAQASTGITVPNLVSAENPDKLEASAGTLLPVMVNAIQELTAMVRDLQSELSILKGTKA